MAFQDKKTVHEKSLLALTQDVKLLNENIMTYTVGKPIPEIAKKHGLTPDDITYFIPHYSSRYFENKLYDMLKQSDFEIPKEKWFTNLETKGNTGSASMYIILEELFASGKLKKGETLLCYIPESGRFSVGYLLLEVV